MVIDDEGFIDRIVRHGPNAPAVILTAIAEEFETNIASEHQPEFWGFATREEWYAFNDEITESYERAFELEVIKYLRGEANEIGSGTIGMIQAEIARKLVEENPI